MNNTINIERGKVQRSQKALIYGPEGIGKSFLASQFPQPIFLDIERGTHHLDVTRFSEINTWDNITRSVGDLVTKAHDFRTLVIDTADWLEQRLVEHICRKSNKNSIEDFGYGKGYVVLAESFAAFLLSLESVIARGVHIVFLAHSTVVKFEAPDQASGYDRYELKLTKRVAPLLKEWVDLILFGNYVTRVTQNECGKKHGTGGRERRLFTTHTAAFDGKNRHGLSEALPFRFISIAHIFASEPLSPIPVQQEALDNSATDRLAELFKGRESQVREFLISRNQLKGDGTWSDIAPDYVARILAQPEMFLQTVTEFQTDDLPK